MTEMIIHRNNRLRPWVLFLNFTLQVHHEVSHSVLVCGAIDSEVESWKTIRYSTHHSHAVCLRRIDRHRNRLILGLPGLLDIMMTPEIGGTFVEVDDIVSLQCQTTHFLSK